MQRRSNRAGIALASMFAAMIVASCADTTAPRIAVLVGVSGSGQSALAGTLLPQPFVVRVEDQAGVAVEGFTVTWEVTAGGGSVAEDQSATDAQGLASTSLVLGLTPGVNRVTASIGSQFDVTFTATGTAVIPSP
jgi:hypothetical protein